MNTLGTYPITINDQYIESNKEKAAAFNKYFIETGKLNKTKFPVDYKMIMKEGMKDGKEEYNQSLTWEELVKAIRKLKNNSPGMDMIENIFLKKAPNHLLQDIFDLFNTSWLSGSVPLSWKKGLVVPIQKPGKPKGQITSYRPITLLPSIGKLMERLVSERLDYIVEKRRLLSDSQCGFRRGLSTMDVLLRIQHNIKQNMNKGKYYIVVYLDLKGAFDRVWHQGLLYKLAKLGIKGNLFRWLFSYLSERVLS